MARKPEEIAESLELLATRLSGVTAHQINQLAAELKGEEVPLSPNEVRLAELVKERAEAAEAEAEALRKTADALGDNEKVDSKSKK